MTKQAKMLTSARNMPIVSILMIDIEGLRLWESSYNISKELGYH